MTTSIRQNLKTLALCQLLFGTILSIAVGLIWGFQLGASFAVGAALMLLILTFLVITVWLSVAQKSIAWNVIVIVIKYPVLLGSIVLLMRSDWFSSTSAALGITSFLVAALAWAVLQQMNTKEEDSLGSF